jgi:L-idonate 5-dehydrogenase
VSGSADSRPGPAVVVHGIGDLRIDDITDRAPGPGEVQICVRYGGICGSDLHYLERGAVGRSAIREPLLLGHELAGEVTELGAGVAGLDVGQRVTVLPATPCWVCAECRSSRPEKCAGSLYLGSAARVPHVRGGFRRRLVIWEGQVVPIPDTLPLPRAALAEPLAVALHAIGRLPKVRDSTLLVVGAGPIGLLTVAALRLGGAARVIARDLSQAALDLALAIGADAIELAGSSQASEAVDGAIECSGSDEGLATALGRTRRRGRVVEVGMTGESSSVDVSRLVTNEIELVGSFRSESEILDAVELLAAYPVFDELVAARFPIRRAVDAFAFASDPARAGKVLLEI